ncbi:hypothetical protein F5Y06DRAFT_292188 [Hypoxylon sp. FL0890]|nr:hypothetical protein F5Y06DRAFT_292188 [Hypoxylon sp. FL0890]
MPSNHAYSTWAPTVGSQTAYQTAHANPPKPEPKPNPTVAPKDGGYGGSKNVERTPPINIPPKKKHHRRNNSSPSFRRVVRGVLSVLSSRERARQRQSEARREANRRFLHAVREGVATADAHALRVRAREAFDNRQRLPDEEVHILAILEGVYLDKPGRTRRLKEGLVARLTQVGDSYYFLGRNGYYYRGSDKYGHGVDLDFVVDTWVPLHIRLLSQPYRQLCRR